MHDWCPWTVETALRYLDVGTFAEVTLWENRSTRIVAEPVGDWLYGSGPLGDWRVPCAEAKTTEVTRLRRRAGFAAAGYQCIELGKRVEVMLELCSW